MSLSINHNLMMASAPTAATSTSDGGGLIQRAPVVSLADAQAQSAQALAAQDAGAATEASSTSAAASAPEATTGRLLNLTDAGNSLSSRLSQAVQQPSTGLRSLGALAQSGRRTMPAVADSTILENIDGLKNDINRRLAESAQDMMRAAGQNIQQVNALFKNT